MLERGDEHAEQTRRFVESFVRPRGLDRPAAPILADAIEALGRRPRPSEASGDRALRALLLRPLAAAAWSAAIAGRLRGRPLAAEVA